MRISNVLIFDDKDFPTKDGFLENLPARLYPAFAAKPAGIELADTVSFACYYQEMQGRRWLQRKKTGTWDAGNGKWSGENSENAINAYSGNWIEQSNVDNIISEAVPNGCLVLCDYSWDKSPDRNVRDYVADALEKQPNGNALFVLYTTFAFYDAEDWLERKRGQGQNRNRGANNIIVSPDVLQLMDGESGISLARVKKYFDGYKIAQA
jgi:hypothetical protein